MAGIAFRIERDELHERLGGELPRGAMGLAEGEPGSGRSVLFQRLLYGALENKHRCTWLSTEHGTLGFLRQMRSLGYDVAPAVARGQLLLLSAYPVLGGRAPASEALPRLVGAQRLWDADLVVLDDIGSLVVASVEARGDGPTRALLDAMVQRIRSANLKGTTVLMTSDLQGGAAPLLAPLRSMAEVLLELRVELVGASLARRMLVKRLAGVPERTGDTMGFRVEPGLGLLVEIRSVT
jgi:archaeal flagellar protein FlaH